MNSGHVLLVVTVGMLATGYWLLTPGQAQPPGTAVNVVGVVNIPQVFRESNEIKTLTKEFNKKRDELQTEAKSRKAVLEKNKEALKDFAPGSKDFEQRNRELMREAIDLRVWLEEAQKNLLHVHRLRTEAFYQKISAKIAEIARDDGFQLVLYKEDFQVKDATSPEEMLAMIRQRKVLYNSTRSDLTPKLIEKLNADVITH